MSTWIGCCRWIKQSLIWTMNLFNGCNMHRKTLAAVDFPLRASVSLCILRCRLSIRVFLVVCLPPVSRSLGHSKSDGWGKRAMSILPSMLILTSIIRNCRSSYINKRYLILKTCYIYNQSITDQHRYPLTNSKHQMDGEGSEDRNINQK